MSTVRTVWLSLFVSLLASLLAWASPSVSLAAPPKGDLPSELQDWVSWVEEVEPQARDCRTVEGVTICVWPSYLSLEAGAKGARFVLDVSVFGPVEVQLPGDEEQWPQEVKVDKKSSAVLRVGDVPRVKLEEGRHTVTGFIPWRQMPSSLRLPSNLGLLTLEVGGKLVPHPARSGQGVSLELPVDPLDPSKPEVDPIPEDPPETTEPETVVPDSETLEVSRRLVDGVPLQVTTRVRIHIAGKARELTLPNPELSGARLLQISSPVPLKRGKDGTLVLQVRPGSFDLELTSLLPASPTQLKAPTHPAPWPDNEVWVWNAASSGAPSVGQVSLSGASAVEHARTHAPSEWEGGATYRLDSEASLKFEIISRGVSQTAENHLRLSREMRADMFGDGWTVVDAIAGEMNNGNRLNLLQGQLGSVAANGKARVITVADDGKPGVEVRGPSVNMRATWRHEAGASTLPLGAWSEDFDSVELNFMLPRGWDLFHADGPGSLGPTWIGAWRPLDLILLLGVVILVGRIVSPVAGGAALLGLALAYTRNGDGYVMLLALVAALTILILPLRQRHGKALTLALRTVWALGAFVAAAWVVWRVPAGVAAVWRDGLSALAHVGLEGELEELGGFALALAALAAGVTFLGAMSSRVPAGPARVAALIVTALAGVGVTGLFLQGADDSGVAKLDSGGQNVDYAAVGAQQDMLAAAPEEEIVEEEALDQPTSGRMGKPSSKSKSGLYAMKGAKEAAPAMAPGAYAAGNDDEDVWGGLSGSEVGEAYGDSGLGLVGTGRGGGGTGEGTIGLGNTGLIGKGGGGGTGSGYGRGSGAGFGGRGKRVPRVRQAKAQVKGNLDNDIIRRIVRAHINEVRACYNDGLTRNPDLAGRIAINFVITPNGKVGASVVQESTVSDSTVGNCIAKAAKRWKFPKAEGGGNTIVTYPFTLSPGAEGSDGETGAADPAAPVEERFVAKDVVIPELEAPAIPQTGEGVPEWSGPQWTLRLDRAVKSDEALSLWMVSPNLSRVLAILRALSLMLLLGLVLRAGWLASPPAAPDEEQDEDEDQDQDQEAPDSLRASGGSRSVSGSIGTALLLFLVARPATAAPPNELLEELSERVNAERPLAPTPDCGEQCALINRLDVEATGDQLSLRADMHMAGPGVWALPGSLDSWLPRTVRVDGKSAPALAVHDGRVLVHLAEGRHRVELEGPLDDDTLNLDLRSTARHVSVSASGWRVDGVDEHDLAQSLHLERQSGEQAATGPDAGPDTPEDPPPPSPELRSEDMPPWFAVQRNLRIGARWTVETTVTRLSYGPSPTKVQVPLLPGEKMLEASGKVDDPKSTVTLRHPGDSITWSSILTESAALELTAPEASNWTETWVITCDGAWQCGDEGVPATSDSGGTRVFHPWPKESLQLVFFEPSPAEGQLLAIDSAETRAVLSETGTEVQFRMKVRTATVMERSLNLPAQAHVGSVLVDDAPVPVAKDATEVRLTFQPGLHEVRVDFKLDAGASAVAHAPVVQLGGKAVNARTTLEFADRSERVIVWTSGTGVGPVVWLWPYIAILGLMAFLLARYAKPPLNVLQWFLLSLGFSVLALPVVWLWFMLIEWREREAFRLDTPARFNIAQIALGLMTLMTLGIILLTAKELLTAPTATIVQNWSDGEQLSWYADRVDTSTPAATVVTISTSLWRAIWAAWVVWLAYSCVAWGKWSWTVLTSDGWLRYRAPESEPEPEPEQAPAPEPASEPSSGVEDEQP